MRLNDCGMLGERERTRPQRGWRDEMKELMIGKGLSEGQGILLARNKELGDTMIYGSG